METLLDLKVTYPTDKFKRIEAGIKRAGLIGYTLALYRHADKMALEFAGHPVGDECRLVAEQFRKEFPAKQLIWYSLPTGSFVKHEQELKRQMVDEGPTMVLAAVCEAAKRHMDNRRVPHSVGADAFVRHMERTLRSIIEQQKDQG